MHKQYNREELFQNTIKAAEKFKKSLMELILPLYEPLQELSEILEFHLNKIRNSKNFRELVLCALSMKLQSEILNSCWTVLNVELFNKIIQAKQSGLNNIDDIIVEFYTKDNYKELSMIVQECDSYDFIQNRKEIIHSAYNTMLTTTLQDAANVVIPTLMAQLTGIIEQDIFNAIPEIEKENIRIERGFDQRCIRPVIIEYLWKHNIALYAWQFSDLIANRAFLNDGQIKQLSKEELEKYDKFRPKILHGDIDFLKYGTTKNLIQSWLELYLAITILKEVKNINEEALL